MKYLKNLLGKLRKRDVLIFGIGVAFALLSVKIISIIYNSQTPVPNQSGGISTRWIPPTVKYWQTPINENAKKYNIDPNLLAIIMTMESGGDSNAKSGAGAIGLMQITGPTAKDIASKYLKSPIKKYNLSNPNTNVEFGAAYLAYLRDIFGTAKQGPDWNSTVELIAAAYNGGPSAAASLEDGQGLRDTQTVVYSRDAFNMWRERHAASSPTFDRWKERGGSLLLDAAQKAKQ
jgi:soluble lytic murein transglycosylase-like protein